MSDAQLAQPSCWEGRSWIQCDDSAQYDPRVKSSFKFVSYHVLADQKCALLHYTTTKNWESRSHRLLQELLTYDADVVCLQDVDHYSDWWRPQLSTWGYDSIHKKRTSVRGFHHEGVVVAYKRESFQLFKSQAVELNDAATEERGRAFKERSKTDDVALIAFLQPWQRDNVATAVCVCCAMLSDETGNGDIRMVQSQYLARQIEVANGEFHVPVLMGLSLHDLPASLPYSLLATGRTPLAGQVPKRCQPPLGIATCRGSIQLKWSPPPSSIADSPVLCYRISWRAGGSRIMGFRLQKEVDVGECVQYAEQVGADGNTRMVSLDERKFVIVGLVSDVPYEFRVTAVNEQGEGVWSEVSDPVVAENPDRAPDMPHLVNFLALPELREMREQKSMGDGDWNVLNQCKPDVMHSQTQLTPRGYDTHVLPDVSRSRALPHFENPRSGWKDSLGGQADKRIEEALGRERVLKASVLRDREGFKNKELDFYHDQTLDPLHLDLHPGGVDVGAVGDGDGDGWARERARVRDQSNVMLDCREVLDALGRPNRRHMHDLNLRSAYSSYGVGGEPAFTCSAPQEKNRRGAECLDYIFYSRDLLRVRRLLSLPALSDVNVGERPEAASYKADPSYAQPFFAAARAFDGPVSELLGGGSGGSEGSGGSGGFVSRAQIVETKRKLKASLAHSHTAGNTQGQTQTQTQVQRQGQRQGQGQGAQGFWGGRWAPLATSNSQRYNFWLPNEAFASSHLALAAEFELNDAMLSTQWAPAV